MVVLDDTKLNEENFDNIFVMAESRVSAAFVGQASVSVVSSKPPILLVFCMVT